MSPPLAVAGEVQRDLRVGLDVPRTRPVSGRLKTRTVSSPSHQNQTGLGQRRAARGDGRQPHDPVLAQVARDPRAELRALVDHGSDRMGGLVEQVAHLGQQRAVVERLLEEGAAGREPAAGRASAE